MSRAYALYFDTPRTDWEKRRKLLLLAAIVALHLLFVGWALRPAPRLFSQASSLVVVLLNAASTTHVSAPPRKSTAPVAAMHPAPSARRHEVLTVSVSAAKTEIDGAAPVVTAAAVGKGADASRGSGNAAAPAIFIPPRVLHRWKPRYPAAASAAQQEGETSVLVSIAADGSLEAASVQDSSGSAALDQASLAAVQHYSFKAAEKGGAPIAAQAIVVIEWRIAEAERQEFARVPQDTRDIDVKWQIRATEFLGNQPPARAPCDHMKNPDCAAASEAHW